MKKKIYINSENTCVNYFLFMCFRIQHGIQSNFSIKNALDFIENFIRTLIKNKEMPAKKKH